MFFKNLIEHELLMKSINITNKDKINDKLEQKSLAAYKVKGQLNAKEDAKKKFYYDKYKQRVLNELENDKALKAELINTTETQSNIVNTMVSARRRNLKMEDAYDYQRKKREM